MNKKGFIFDLDGVIVDTAKYHFLAWKELANKIGTDFTTEQNEQLKGVSRVKSLEKILNWANITISDNEFTELMDAKNKKYLEHINQMNENEILPDVKKVLDFLHSKKQKIALGSASKNARPLLKKVQLTNYFNSIVDGTDVTQAKPNPEVFLKAAENLNISPKNCVVFEDSKAGIQAANKANMISIGIGDEKNLSEADYVFKDFTKISESFLNDIINNKVKK
jgi:beta-phosphoglucomutase